MNMMKLTGAALVAVSFGAGSVLADTCSQADFEKKQGELMAYIQANPAKISLVTPIQKEVEQDYGGEPPAEKRCEAVDKIMVKLKAAE